MSSRPFPAMSGGCVCGAVRYRLLTSPLYCYACHCSKCQKQTGSAFSLNLDIELYNIRLLTPTSPLFVTQKLPDTELLTQHAECPVCHVQLWASNTPGDAIVNVRIGTLDIPSLMEPDVHIFTESKLDWVRLPEGARTMARCGDLRGLWPRGSRERLEVCVKRAEEVRRKRGVAAVAAAVIGNGEEGAVAGGGGGDDSGEGEDVAVEGNGEGDRTPTAGEFAGEDEDEEEFEKRFKETERALQERLERLSLKLEGEEVVGKMEKATLDESVAGQDGK